MRKASVASCLVFLILTAERSGPGQEAKHPAASSRLVAVTMERAPGDLGKAGSAGFLFVVTASKGTEVLLFDTASGELKAYLENGEARGKPVHLRGRGGESFSPHAFHMAVNDRSIAFADPQGVNLFKRETGEFVADAPYLHHAAAISAVPDGSWAVSLTRLPFPEIARADKDRFGGPAPRFVILNDKLEVWRQGLAADSDRTPNQAAARTLRLAASQDRVFAAEIANYKVYEFNRQLKLRSTYVDPKLKLEDGLGLSGDQREQERFLAEARRHLAGTGTDATRPTPPGRSEVPRRSAQFFDYQTVIWDMAWDPFSHQLILLLADGIAGDQGALDLLDPTTGQVQRLLLRFPETAARRQLSQLAVGHRYLWLRNHSGSGPTFRLDRAALENARSITGPKVEHLSAAGGR